MLAVILAVLPLALAAPSEHIIGGTPVSDNRAAPWMHPNYDEKYMRYEYDISILALVTEVILVQARPILDNTEQTDQCFILGWDAVTCNNKLTLNKAPVTIMENCQCEAIYGSLFRADVHICTTSPNKDKAACNGDHGGPLICGFGTYAELRGIISWGVPGCDPKWPSVHARIYNSRYGDNLKPWICAYAKGTRGCL